MQYATAPDHAISEDGEDASKAAFESIAAVFDTRTFFERPKMNLRMPSDVRPTVTSRDESCAQMSPYLTIGPAIS